MTGLTAMVLAGSRPGRDAFAEQYGTDLKALIPIAGEAMVRRPVAALLASPRIAEVIVLAQQPERIGAVLPADPRLSVNASEGSIAGTLDRLCSDPATTWPLLVTTADHALLNAEMIEDFCRKASGSDIAVAVVERSALMERLPGSKRTWVGFKGGAYSGANLFLLASPKVAPAIAMWKQVEQDRKRGWRLLAALGPAVLLGALLRLRTLDQSVATVGRKLGIDIRAVQLSDPLAAIDVDKPEDHRLVEAIIRGNV